MLSIKPASFAHGWSSEVKSPTVSEYQFYFGCFDVPCRMLCGCSIAKIKTSRGPTKLMQTVPEFVLVAEPGMRQKTGRDCWHQV